MKTAILTRDKDTGKETLGTLVCETFKCKTLELPWKDNKSKISCIPKGEYIVKWTFSPLFMKYTYEVQNVPGRTGIRQHPGNYFFNFLGCQTFGTGYTDLNKDGELDILNTTATLKKFADFTNREPYKLIIK